MKSMEVGIILMRMDIQIKQLEDARWRLHSLFLNLEAVEEAIVPLLEKLQTIEKVTG